MKKIIAIQSNNLKTINPLTDTSLQLVTTTKLNN